MSIVVRECESGSGLLVAEQAADREAVARLLRAHDPNLRLVPQPHPGTNMVRWCVYSWNGPDRPSDFVTDWTTPTGDPLPLSARLVDEVQLLDKRTVGDAPDPKKINAARAAAAAKDMERRAEAITDDHRPYVDRGRVSVSLTDAKTETPHWRRHRRPKRQET